MEINHLRARIKSLKGENESISETCDAYITEATELQDRIDELEEKSDFNERWISQTCETGQIKAERNQNIASDATWILTVLPQEPEDD